MKCVLLFLSAVLFLGCPQPETPVCPEPDDSGIVYQYTEVPYLQRNEGVDHYDSAWIATRDVNGLWELFVASDRTPVPHHELDFYDFYTVGGESYRKVRHTRVINGVITETFYKWHDEHGEIVENPPEKPHQMTAMGKTGSVDDGFGGTWLVLRRDNDGNGVYDITFNSPLFENTDLTVTGFEKVYSVLYLGYKTVDTNSYTRFAIDGTRDGVRTTYWVTFITDGENATLPTPTIPENLMERQYLWSL